MDIRINNLKTEGPRSATPMEAALLSSRAQSPRVEGYEDGQDLAKTPLPQLKMPHFRKDGEPVKLEDILTLEGEVLQLFA